ITQDLLIGSLATSSAKFAVINVNNGTPVASLSAGTAGGAYLTASGILATTAKQSLVLGDANTGNVIVNNLGTGIVHSTNGLLSSSAVDLASGDVTGILSVAKGGSPFDQGSGSIFARNITQDLLIGGQSTGSATFHVYGTNALAGTQAVASIAGNTSFASLVIDNKTGDLFTASSSGLSRFTIGQNGSITTNGVLGQSVISASCITSTNGIVTGTGSCTTPLSSFIWSTNSGAIVEGNITQDLLIGSQATSSAKFAVLNVNNGTPVASVSAGVNGAAFLKADGTLATTAKQSLIFGDSNTGNIVLNGFSQNGGVLFTNGSGVISQVVAGGANTILHGGTVPSFSAVDLASADVTGILSIAKGGSPFDQGSGSI